MMEIEGWVTIQWGVVLAQSSARRLSLAAIRQDKWVTPTRCSSSSLAVCAVSHECGYIGHHMATIVHLGYLSCPVESSTHVEVKPKVLVLATLLALAAGTGVMPITKIALC
ncbi:hypothetical protein H920_07473 [Fukomys damarensis]|uniref:Uncharacterized protein n=1 Tax=Fukomys damarensis TaxID=885580 RepID=A0A091DKM8_FUKDA|nr:hypothetical protein H920_07473 [Fukomys damarensis]